MVFPSPNKIWQGAVLNTIVHAIAITSDPILSYEVGWDGKNYTRNDTMGARGVITFNENIVVGAFSYTNSQRHIFHHEHRIEWTEYFKDASNSVLTIAKEETSLYLLEDYKSAIRPVVTTAFWGDSKNINSNDNWQGFMEHGGHLISIECLDLAQALNAHQENWEMNQEQIELARQLYLRKLRSRETIVTRTEYETLISEGIEGLTEAKLLLNKIGIKISD